MLRILSAILRICNNFTDDFFSIQLGDVSDCLEKMGRERFARDTSDIFRPYESWILYTDRQRITRLNPKK